MKALFLDAASTFRLGEYTDPDANSSVKLRLKVQAVTVCGSDLHLLHGDIPMLPGESCGHEFCGVIEEIGSGVQKFMVGDRVVGTFHTACGQCHACARGEFHLCSSSGVFGYGQSSVP